MMSGEIIQFISKQELCSYCGRRPATKLCDMPVRQHFIIGHPIRTIGWNGFSSMDKSIPASYTATCDRPVCDKCATSVGYDIDFCPDCMEHIRNTAIRYKK